MIIVRTARGDDGNPFLIAVFGAGLIGRSVIDALAGRHQAGMSTMPLQWSSPAARTADLAAIDAQLRSELRACSAVRILWSAGRAGFLSSDSDAAEELASFREIVQLSESIAKDHPDRRLSFHMVSSAGGLFEGQRHVNSSNTPEPRRPYGRLKLAQERILNGSAMSRSRIYRVSSVYGHVTRGVRSGLVPTLITDGFRRSVTRINATSRTLRDFVFADDLGAYIAQQLLDTSDDKPVISLLTRNRPCSLLEVQHMIEGIFQRKLYVSYSVDAGNSADITFAGTPPNGWHPSDLRSNVAPIYQQALTHLSAANRPSSIP